MNTQSGTSGQVISLPRGGGALQGIGETFSPDLFTGTGNYTVPLVLPSGRNGFQPDLNLVYSTGQGNGPFGLGWRLNIPGVTRKTSKGVPRYRDETDVFVFSGVEDLVPTAQDGSKIVYRPRTEGLFARIERVHQAGSSYWKVQRKDGLVSHYGTAPAGSGDPAVVADPADDTRIFSWKLALTQDLFGNRIEYSYERDRGEEAPRFWDQLYLKQIRYADYLDGADTEFLVTVTFDYEARPDPFSEYRSGFEIRTRKRCARIEVHTHAEHPRLVRTYVFSYLDQREDLADLARRLPRNGVSLLSRVGVIGSDGDVMEALPPLEFGYTGFEPEERGFSALEGADLPLRSLGDPNLELVDLFGNGLPDLLEMNGASRYWQNLGNGRFDLPQSMPYAPAGLTLAQAGVQFMDASGDGRMDLLVTKPGVSGYFPLRSGGLWDRRSFRRYGTAPSFNLEDPEVRLVDLDGDGVTDAIRSGSRLECYFNDPEAGWSRTRQVARQHPETFPSVQFSDPRVRFADLCGDGLKDVVLIYDGSVEYWPNLGHGNWGRRITTRNSPRFPYGYDPARILMGDVDGDGLADLVYVDHCKVLVWINQGGEKWSDPIRVGGTPPGSGRDGVRLTDLLGAGVDGVLWTADAGTASGAHAFFLDFTGGQKPYLLNEVDNHMGAVTRVAYRSSTADYLADQHHPETRWQTPLSFPVQVVACVEVIDGISGGKLTTEYRYHHGYWDGTEREFRGFGRVDRFDTEVFERYHDVGLHPERHFEAVEAPVFSPPLETRTWFHLGPVEDASGVWKEPDFGREYGAEDPNMLARPPEMVAFLGGLPRRMRRDALRALRGRVLRTEQYAPDGSERQDRPYRVDEYLYGVCAVLDEPGLSRLVFDPGELPENWGTDGVRAPVFFPHLLAERTTQWERGDEPMVRFGFSEDYDVFGQPRKQTQIACPRGWRALEDVPSRPYLATRIKTEYAVPVDAGVHIQDRVARTTRFEIQNDGTGLLLDLKATPDHSASLNIIGQTLTFYDGLASQGLPFGQVGDYGAPSRTETLVLTEALLRDACRSGDVLAAPPEVPPYLEPGGISSWTADYPQEFRDLLPSLAGYRFEPGAPNGDLARGYFAAEKRRYDFHEDAAGAGQGMLRATKDSLGHETEIGYDTYNLLPVRVRDAAGLMTQVVADYRVLQPALITDPNGSRTRYAFTPLGRVKNIAVMGKEGEDTGDTPDRPGTFFEYDFPDFSQVQRPVSVRTIRRVHHAHDTGIPLPERDETIEMVEYSDGFGRLVQTRATAADVAFGNVVYGGQVLPADPKDQTGTQATIAGQQRAAGDPPRVVVSGWQVYDNKGRVVKKYEPFFSTGWIYAPPSEAQFGQKVTTFYDPDGLAVRAVNPDGSEKRMVRGIPADLADPTQFVPTPWETYVYDTQDNAGRTHPDETSAYQHHWNTPTSSVVDALGRVIETVVRNGPVPATDWYKTHPVYDIRDNLLKVTDALGRQAFSYVYDLADRPLRIESIDAGVRRTVLDAAGNEVERRDSKGALVLQAHDVLNRPVRFWARDDAAGSLTLRERLSYGDGGDPNQTATDRDANRARNRLGRLFEHHDEAGLLRLTSYDFKGNILEKVRRVISDHRVLSVFGPAASGNGRVAAFRVDWQTPGGLTFSDHEDSLLAPVSYRTSMTYDALNRAKAMQYPEDVDGDRKTLKPRYNRAGALESVELNGTPYVEHIAYNARGQRTVTVYGNGVMTRHAYDERTFRLVRLRTERRVPTGAYTYQPAGSPLQDFVYTYDLAGNILGIEDRTPGSGVLNNADALSVADPQLAQRLAAGNALVRRFEYDPLYRLTLATGREHATPPTAPPWADQVRSQDLSDARRYTQTYEYDPVGNTKALRHQADGGAFTRDFGLASGSNRLTGMTIGTSAYVYTCDANGNMTGETDARHFEWDHSDRLRAYRTQTRAGGAAPGEDAWSEPSIYAHYLYDAGGQRVMKLVRRQGGGYDVRVYIDGVFEHFRWDQNSAHADQNQNTRLHIMDDQQRIGLVRVGDSHPDDRSPAVQYHLGDYLGSSHVVVDDGGTWFNREEYLPYGETAFGGFSKKRFRFTGKERDEETALYFYGARYLAPWLARWISPDPLFLRFSFSGTGNGIVKEQGHVSNPNLYQFVRQNPVGYLDPNGENEDRPRGVDIESRADLFFPEGKSYTSDYYRGFAVEAKVKIVPSDEFTKKVGRWAAYDSWENIIYVREDVFQKRAAGSKEQAWQAMVHEMVHAFEANFIEGFIKIGPGDDSEPRMEADTRRVVRFEKVEEHIRWSLREEKHAQEEGLRATAEYQQEMGQHPERTDKEWERRLQTELKGWWEGIAGGMTIKNRYAEDARRTWKANRERFKRRGLSLKGPGSQHIKGDPLSPR